MSGHKRVIRLKNNAEQEVIDFMNKQSNLSDAIYFLMQKEVFTSGVRNLSEHIPAIRTYDYFKNSFTDNQEKKYKEIVIDLAKNKQTTKKEVKKEEVKIVDELKEKQVPMCFND